LSDFVKYRHTHAWKTASEAKGNEAKKKTKTERAVKHLLDVQDYQKLRQAHLPRYLLLFMILKIVPVKKIY